MKVILFRAFWVLNLLNVFLKKWRRPKACGKQHHLHNWYTGVKKLMQCDCLVGTILLGPLSCVCSGHECWCFHSDTQSWVPQSCLTGGFWICTGRHKTSWVIACIHRQGIVLKCDIIFKKTKQHWGLKTLFISTSLACSVVRHTEQI